MLFLCGLSASWHLEERVTSCETENGPLVSRATYSLDEKMRACSILENIMGRTHRERERKKRERESLEHGKDCICVLIPLECQVFIRIRKKS